MNDEQNSPPAKLLWSDPRTGAAREFALREGGSATIGRAESNDVHIPEKRVSRRHAVIGWQDGRFSINDLDSANGTAVNRQPVINANAHPLQDGDVITFGVIEARFHLTEQKQEAET